MNLYRKFNEFILHKTHRIIQAVIPVTILHLLIMPFFKCEKKRDFCPLFKLKSL